MHISRCFNHIQFLQKTASRIGPKLSHRPSWQVWRCDEWWGGTMTSRSQTQYNEWNSIYAGKQHLPRGGGGNKAAQTPRNLLTVSVTTNITAYRFPLDQQVCTRALKHNWYRYSSRPGVYQWLHIVEALLCFNRTPSPSLEDSDNVESLSYPD